MVSMQQRAVNTGLRSDPRGQAGAFQVSKLKSVSLKQRLGEGRRMTGQRKVIADIVAAAKDHPDAREIHRRAQARDSGISLSTVYRTLKLFAELGMIERHTFEGGSARIERAPTAHHDHLIDVDTGQLIEFRSAEIERLQGEIARRLGYELTGHHLELYGRRKAK
jgi:Fur family transcriptional regulator, ferric uptake regulator